MAKGKTRLIPEESFCECRWPSIGYERLSPRPTFKAVPSQKMNPSKVIYFANVE